MKNTFIFILFTFFYCPLNAQLGINIGAKALKANEWTNFLNEAQQNQVTNYKGFHIGLDYWFRLKKYRIEFLPEVSFEKFKEDFGLGKDELTVYNFYFNTNIYLLNIEGDCDCPTFSKGGDFFEKGFFIQISPGISYISSNFVAISQKVEDKNSSFGIGIGAGIDIGISDYLTITPIAKYTFLPTSKRENLETAFQLEPDAVDTAISQLYLGLRIGLRWND